jgi:hypothetical protein
LTAPEEAVGHHRRGGTDKDRGNQRSKPPGSPFEQPLSKRIIDLFGH